MSDYKSVVLTLPARWETFWRMVALIVTDVSGETNSRFDPLVKWICQDSLIQRETVVCMPSNLRLTNTNMSTERSAVSSSSVTVEIGGRVYFFAG